MWSARFEGRLCKMAAAAAMAEAGADVDKMLPRELTWPTVVILQDDCEGRPPRSTTVSCSVLALTGTSISL